MDVPREIKPNRRKYYYGAAIGLAVLLLSAGLARLKPAAPTVEKQSVLVDTVKRGETLSSISGRHKVAVKDLMALNKLTNKSVLKAGQELMVRTEVPAGARDGGQEVTVAKAETGQGRKIAHKVAAGQNPTVIARKYGVTVTDLFSWNGWKTAPVLKVGDTVTVFAGR